MKLRIQGNSIRFRLTRTEVDQFARQGRMEEGVEFENGDGFVGPCEMVIAVGTK